jgi:hypothetical protein
MVQGKTKGLSQKASGSNSGRHAQRAASNTKKGKRHIPPKKAQLVKQAAMHKVRRRSYTALRLISHLFFSN